MTELVPRGLYLYEPESAARRWLLAPLALLEIPYRIGARIHRQLYARGLRARTVLPAHVVSIGNLLVGGSGKTPTAGWLARELAARGRRVAVLSRGVRAARPDAVNVVSDGNRVLLGAAEAGDEPVWLAATTGVPVLSGRDRAALGCHAVERFGSEILILDDGFQHHRLARDLDLVCVDASFGFGNGRVLPRGPLREPVSALKQADALILTRAPIDAESPPLPAAAARLPRFALQMRPLRLRSAMSGALLPVEDLRGAAIGVLAALARPQPLRDALVRAGARIVGERLLPDHHPYTSADIAALDRSLRWITTAKDAVKLQPQWLVAHRVDVLEEEVVPVGPGDLPGWVLAQLARLRPLPAAAAKPRGAPGAR